MKKFVIYITVFFFTFTASIQPVASTLGHLPISFSSAYAQDNTGLSSMGDSFVEEHNEDNDSDNIDTNSGESPNIPHAPNGGGSGGGGGGTGGGSERPPGDEGAAGSNDDNSSGLPVVSENQTDDLVEYCINETGKSPEECERDVLNENISNDEIAQIQKENEELAKSFGVNHGSVTLIISAALQGVGTIIAFFSGGYKFPSNYLSLAVSCILVIGFWVNLVEYNKYANQLSEKEYGAEGTGEEFVNPTDFYNEQITILENSKPYLENINKALEISIGITYATIVVSLIESIICIVTSGAYCACNQKQKTKDSIKNFIDSFLPSKLHANPISELNDANELAEQEVEKSKVDVDADNWRKIIGSIVSIVLQSILKGSGTGTTMFSMLAINEILKSIFKESLAEGLARLGAFVKTIIFIVDQVGYYKNKDIYTKGLDKIDERIEKLKEMAGITEQAIAGIGTAQNTIAPISGAPDSIASSGQAINPDNLGSGSCNSFDYKNPEVRPTSCDKAKVNLPKPMKIDTSGIAGIDSFADALDPEETYENLKKAIATKEGVKSSEFTKNAKKAKKLMPKLLKMMNKKKIVFDKNQKKKDIKPLYLQVLNAAKKRDAAVASLSNKFFNDLAKENKVSPKKLSSDKKGPSKKPISAPVINLPKVKPISLSVEDDEEATSSETSANYGALDNFESSAEDIVKKKGVSLWKVISVRYQKSAYDDLLELKK